MMTAINIASARIFAIAAHSATGQKRKYTHEPYHTHPAKVAAILDDARMPFYVIAAGWLHDVVEDTEVTFDLLGELFNDVIVSLVAEVTDVSRSEDGNRKARKAKDLAHLAKSSPNGASIKLADIIDNTRSIVANDPGFAPVYLREKQAVLEVLSHGDPDLFRMALSIVEGAILDLGLDKSA
jgi:(p)ppGpp synthase/HD superfamily hydrolase